MPRPSRITQGVVVIDPDSRIDVNKLRPGMSVKITVCRRDSCEGFWTLVERVEGDMIHAKVDNYLSAALCRSLPVGGPIRFRREHIRDVIVRPPAAPTGTTVP